MLRVVRAVWLFLSIFASYAWQGGLAWVVRLPYVERRWEAVHQRNAARLAKGFARLRGVFIKAGQIVSVLGTFLPRAYAEELEVLQDAVPPRPFSSMKERLKHAFGADALERFQSFDEEALASASLAQVHRAVTHDGRKVAVKLLYPGIEKLVKRDLAVLRLVYPMVGLVFPVKRLNRVIEQLEAMLNRELDYANERRNMDRMRALFADRNDVVIPRAIDELCSDGVLTMTYEEGVKVTDLEGLRVRGIEASRIAQILVECYFDMLLEHRVFHADPHPGNFLARINSHVDPPRTELVMLDFGAVEEVTDALASGMKTVVLGGVSRNTDLVMQGLEQMGFVAEGGNRELLGKVGKEYLQVLGGLNIQDYAKFSPSTVEKLSGFQQLRGRLREVMKNIAYPDGYFYVERTLALLFGLTGQLAPDKGLPGLAAPLASRALLKGFARRTAPKKPATEAAPP